MMIELINSKGEWSSFLPRSRLLRELPELLEDLRGVRGDAALDVGEDPAEVGIRVDEVGLPVGEGTEAWHLEGASVGLGQLPVPVGQHEEVQPLRGAEGGVLLGRVDRDADDLGA